MKVMARAAALVTALLLGCTASGYAEQAEWTAWVNVAADSCLCVRAEARKDAKVKYRLMRGESYTVTAEKGGWCYIVCCEDGGWVYGAYLSSGEVSEDGDEVMMGAVAGNGRVAVRTAPGGKIVRWVHPGDAVEVTGERVDADGNVWRITADGRYISAEYVEMEGE